MMLKFTQVPVHGYCGKTEQSDQNRIIVIQQSTLQKQVSIRTYASPTYLPLVVSFAVASSVLLSGTIVNCNLLASSVSSPN